MPKKSTTMLDELEEKVLGTSEEVASAEEAPAEKKRVAKKAKVSNVFDKFTGYQPTSDEIELVHVAIAKIHYSPVTGEYDGQIPFVQKFNARDFANFERNAESMGYSFSVLYNPN